ncbi:MAG: hypothetical protein LCH52_00935 [Bacteroidetes bacterium]|nr:hypothetical protein [Bacteroidota bacterium]
MDINNTKNNQNIFYEIEDQAARLRVFLEQNSSRGLSLYYINKFLFSLFSYSNPLLVEANFTEFFPLYLKLLKSFDPTGQKIVASRMILKNAIRLYKSPGNEFRRKALCSCIKEKKQQISQIESTLEGTISTEVTKTLPVFPVIESVRDEILNFTYLDSITVKLSPSKISMQFKIHPTFKEEDEKVLEQVKTSFEYAYNFVFKRDNKSTCFFDVQVFFNSRLGVYSGDSFGVLLTLLFIIELKKLITPNLIYSIAPGLALTGSINEKGEILRTGNRNISKKMAAVFYSGVSNFVVPENDGPAATFVLEQLTKKYPKRNLKVTSVESIEDILNRRNILIISKKPYTARIKDFAIKHKYAFFVLIPVLLVTFFVLQYQFDSNPVAYEFKGRELLIKNQFGNVIWRWGITQSTTDLQYPWQKNRWIKILDVDGDKRNEVALVEDLKEGIGSENVGQVTCYKSENQILWSFSFRDTVSSPKEQNIPGYYGLQLIDTVTIGGEKLLYLNASSIPTFPQAVYALSLRTGARKQGTLWHAGGYSLFTIIDLGNDGSYELVAIARDNGNLVNRIFAVPLAFKDQMVETHPDYMLYNKPKATLLFEIRPPSNDYTIFTGTLNGDILAPSERERDIYNNSLHFLARYSSNQSAVAYRVLLNLKTLEMDYFIEGGFRALRDSLVKAGKLTPPYTDTKEYTDRLKNGVRYRKDGKWVTYQEYLRK